MSIICEAPGTGEQRLASRGGESPLAGPSRPTGADGLAEPIGSAVSLHAACDFAAQPLKWLWKDHFALGKLAVVAGEPEVGKSLLVTGEFAMHVSTGTPWPDGSDCPRGDVVVVGGHDDVRDIVVPWLSAHGADLTRVHFADGVTEQRSEPGPRFTSLFRLPAFDAALRRLPGVKLVIFDPVADFQNCTGATLTTMREMAQRHGAAFIVVTGMSPRRGMSRLDAIGNPELVSAARSVWLVEDDPDNRGRRLFIPIRNKFGGQIAGYAWGLCGGRVMWEADRIKPPPAPIDSTRARERRDAMAAAFIADFLIDGPRQWSVIEQHAREAGHGPRSLERVRSGVAECFKQTEVETRWLWRLIGDPHMESEADDMDDYPTVGLPMPRWLRDQAPAKEVTADEAMPPAGQPEKANSAEEVEEDDEDDLDDEGSDDDDGDDDEEVEEVDKGADGSSALTAEIDEMDRELDANPQAALQKIARFLDRFEER